MRWPVDLAALALITCLPLNALAFGTINGLGQKGEHERITRLALRDAGFERHSLDELAGKNRSWGAVGAPDNPARLLVTSDRAHCDNGDYLDLPDYPHAKTDARLTLSTCRQWIFGHLNIAVRDAGDLLDRKGRIRGSQIPTYVSCTYLGRKGRAKCNVFEALGLAFHASQDFYSHSNWTDKTPSGPLAPANPPGLAGEKPAPWLDPTIKAAFPDGLMTGCFGLPEKVVCKGRTQHAHLNKDMGAIDLETGPGAGRTPRGRADGNFARAATVAAADTKAKWDYFRKQVVQTYGKQRGNRILCALTRDKPTKTCR